MNTWIQWKKICFVILLWAAPAISAPGQTFTTLVSFNYTNGADPLAGLVQGADGYLYGTTKYGGTCALYNLGCGTVFKISTAGDLTTLHYFAGPDGAFPNSGLLLDIDGNFYGTTQGGGAHCTASNGCGTVFRITSSGKQTTLYNFCAQAKCADGYEPSAALIRAMDGSLYGTTALGGNSRSCSLGCGTIFKIAPGGTLTSVYSFSGPPGGLSPSTRLVQATDGNFFGTTAAGGVNCGGAGCGSIYKMTPSGTVTTLYSFCALANCADGEAPYAGLIQALDGSLYGTTTGGGTSANCVLGCGTIFKITPGGSLKTLHSFEGTDGFDPSSELIQATDGNFYGTTVEGGYLNSCPGGCGTIFEMSAGGALTTLYNLTAPAAAGEDLRASLLQATDGTFYGTAYVGGQDGAGTVFSLATGLGPFVRPLPHSGNIGAAVMILGTNLTGATSVSFNGVSAEYTVVSATEISATVPTGATSGKIQVTTPGGTLLSGAPFLVRP